MSTLVKILVTLGLVLPMGAFVAGSLAASSADEPAPRETIVIRDSPTRTASPDGDRTPSPSPGHDAGDDHGGDRGDDHSGDDDVIVIVPSPDDLDDHGDDDGGEVTRRRQLRARERRLGHGSDDSGARARQLGQLGRIRQLRQ